MKIYIPTSTLNLDSILSSDSISPKSFYQDRVFGNKYWYEVEENNFDNVILLYKTPHCFSRPKGDLEDHPMLIEFDTDEEFPNVQDGVLYSDHTLYFNPWKTCFHFFEEHDRVVALSLVSHSIEAKMYRLYYKKMLVSKFDGEIPPIDVVPNISKNVAELTKDVRINSIKGAFYGYYIGALLSASKDDVDELNIYREILNISSSIISSEDMNPTQSQNNRLQILFGKLRKKEAIYTELTKVLGCEELVEAVTVVLQRYGKSPFENKCEQLIQSLKKDSDKELSFLKKELDRLQIQVSRKRVPLSIDKAEILLSENETLLLSPEIVEHNVDKQLFEHWINQYFTKKGSLRKIGSQKVSLSDELTDEAKSCIEDEKWKESREREFLNNLRRHARGEEFAEPWRNDVLSSIAAVITKGDDWETLLVYMQKREMTDYRLAFAFYGAIVGFANLPQDFTNLLYDLDRKYVAGFYKELYGQLHGCDLSSDLSKMNEATETDYSIDQKQPIPECLKNIFDSIDFKKLKPEAQNWYKEKTLELWQNFGQITKDFISELKKISSDPMTKDRNGKCKNGWGKWKDCIKLLEPTKPSKNCAKMPQQETLFDMKEEYPVGEYFYNDINVWFYIEHIIPEQDKAKVKKEIEWIQKAYQDGGYKLKNGTFIECKKIDNASVIDHFYNNNKKRIEKNFLTEICNKLKELYHVK